MTKNMSNSDSFFSSENIFKNYDKFFTQPNITLSLGSFTKIVSKTGNKSLSALSAPIILATSCKLAAKVMHIFSFFYFHNWLNSLCIEGHLKAPTYCITAGNP